MFITIKELDKNGATFIHESFSLHLAKIITELFEKYESRQISKNTWLLIDKKGTPQYEIIKGL